MNLFAMHSTQVIRILLLALFTTFSGGGWVIPHVFGQEVEEADPPEVTNGERLFLETRFAQLFKIFLDEGGDVNDPL
ncbi:MAG: hypothetical protein KC584_00970, partial [Nitrospira sp.]|nr:hypothetical protein [Nitrospira sp.]